MNHSILVSLGLNLCEVVLYGIFLRAAIYHVRRKQYLQMIGWLLFCQVLMTGLDLADIVWTDIATLIRGR